MDENQYDVMWKRSFVTEKPRSPIYNPLFLSLDVNPDDNI